MMQRREFLKKTFLASTLLSTNSLFGISLPVDKTLKLYNIHTGETISSTFFSKDGFVDEELARLDYFLRDFRLNKVEKMDINLYSLLYAIQITSNSKEPLEILSGYRNIKTNNYLKKHNHNVAKHSYHTVGRAIDFNIQDRYLKDTLKIAKLMEMGGVGYYPRNRFIHVDTGPIRFWRG